MLLKSHTDDVGTHVQSLNWIADSVLEFSAEPKSLEPKHQYAAGFEDLYLFERLHELCAFVAVP